MLNARSALGTALLAGFLLFSGVAVAQTLTITIPGEPPQAPAATQNALPAGIVLPDRLAEQIRTLIRIAMITGDATAFENALFDLTTTIPDFAAAIASFTTTEVHQQASVISTQTAASPTPSIVTSAFVQSMTIASTAGPATAAPAKFKEIIAATAKVMAALPATTTLLAVSPTVMMEKITSQVETGLISLFNDDSITAANLPELFTASGPADLTEAPTTQSASPTG